MEKREYIVGIDVGTNSIGWAIFEKEVDSESFVDGGVRVFPEPLETKTKEPKNAARRGARLLRRQISRRGRRKQKVKNLLIAYGLLPKGESEQKKLFETTNPYELRAKGLSESLSQSELGRALFHLSQRRGFLSNRKSGKSNEDGVVLSGINETTKKIEETESKTLGEYFFSVLQKDSGEKVRSHYTKRDMYQEEFKMLWEKQESFHPELTKEKKEVLFDAIFYQRPLKSQKGLVGNCTFEKDHKKAQKASLVAQEFLVWQDINNLRFQNAGEYDYTPLSAYEREKLALLLLSEGNLSFAKINTHLGFPKKTVWNLERSKKTVAGNRTLAGLKKALGEQVFSALGKEKQEKLVELIITTENADQLKNTLLSRWNFTAEQTEKLLLADAPNGYMNISQKAMRKMIPFLEQGMRYDEAAKEAGYLHFEKKEAQTDSFTVPNLRNPSVEKSLHEVKKVLRNIETTFGIPLAIHVELARDLKVSDKRKREQDKKNKENRDGRDIVKEVLQEKFGREPSREETLKYQLWQESKGICPYSGEEINLERLFQDVDIEHILPYSRTLDDSFMNKTLCIASFNRNTKGNKTPFEIGEGDSKWFQDLQNRLEILEKMPMAKKRRFLQETLDTDEQVGRLLNDTRYIGREVTKMIKRNKNETTVQIGNGKLTSLLRHLWGMEEIMPPKIDSETGEVMKNRSDHRHHFIDACVIALTSKSLLQKASSASAKDKLHEVKEVWKSLSPNGEEKRKIREKFEKIVISFAPTHKIDNAIHEQTAYGKIEDGKYTKRVSLSSITAGQIERIRDREVKSLVLERISAFDEDIKKAFGTDTEPFFHKDGKTRIESVRIEEAMGEQGMMPVKDKKTGIAYKFFPTGGNHHIEIIEHKTKKNSDGTLKRAGVVVKYLEAMNRARRQKLPIVNRTGEWILPNGEVAKPEEWRFVMSLCPNDIVEVQNGENKQFYRVQKMTGTEITLRRHISAEISDNSQRIILSASTSHRVRKIQVDPLGRVSPAGD